MLEEIRLLQDTYQNLSNLDKSGKLRVVLWLINHFDIESEIAKRLPTSPVLAPPTLSAPVKIEPVSIDYQTLSQSELVLLLAFQLNSKGIINFQARHISQELNRNGLQLTNVAKVLNDLLRRQLVAQVKLSGANSQRKQYRLTASGQTEAKLLANSLPRS